MGTEGRAAEGRGPRIRAEGQRTQTSFLINVFTCSLLKEAFKRSRFIAKFSTKCAYYYLAFIVLLSL